MSNTLSVFFLLLLLIGCTPNQKSGNSVKFQQYFVEGEQLYIQHCSNCHQKSGKGLGLVYPPLDESDYMNENIDDVLCLIKNGISGELIVNGKGYNQAMPGIPTLTDLEIAEIATYIYNSWSHNHGIVEVKQVTKALEGCDTAI